VQNAFQRRPAPGARVREAPGARRLCQRRPARLAYRLPLAGSRRSIRSATSPRSSRPARRPAHRTIGRPLLLLDVVQGHGRDNLQHELELGDAGVTSPRAADVTRSALAALDQVKPPSASRPGSSQAGSTRSPRRWRKSAWPAHSAQAARALRLNPRLIVR
jgi:hypothetical protein